MTSRHIVILTGAGVSAESGLGTFRDAGGMWKEFDPMKLATSEAFAKDPATVHEFYNLRRRNLINAQPNEAHRALARLETGLRDAGSRLTLITQNIDDLHERGGSHNVIHMHGELLKARCARCGEVDSWRDDMSVSTACPGCEEINSMRPHVVWFGEMPLRLDDIADAIASATVFASIGTSGSVYPAAGFVAEARANGVPTVELNLEPSDNAEMFDEGRYGKASEVAPLWVEELMGT